MSEQLPGEPEEQSSGSPWHDFASSSSGAAPDAHVRHWAAMQSEKPSGVSLHVASGLPRTVPSGRSS